MTSSATQPIDALFAAQMRTFDESAPEALLEARQRWDRGQPVDAQAVLAEHPEWRADKHLVAKLAYEEYYRRRNAGQTLDVEQFVSRFPQCQSSLRHTLQSHELLEQTLAEIEQAQRPAPPPWPRAGETFLGFFLVRELGRGTMARVFLATEMELGDRQVVVKISPLGSGEAETLGRLGHPNIIPVHSVRRDPVTGLAVVCMPFMGQATLHDVLDEAFRQPGLPQRASVILRALQEPAPLDARAAQPAANWRGRGSYIDAIVTLAAELADALAFVHQRGIFHRDLKPSNVLLTAEGRPILLDFNLAVDERRLTEYVGGTMAYMSPEQLRAVEDRSSAAFRALGARADIFSLAVILYELLAGIHPFGPQDWQSSAAALGHALRQRQLEGPVALRTINPGVDPSLARTITRALAHDPNERHASTADFARELRRHLRRDYRLRRWLARHWVSSCAVVLVLAGFVGLGVHHLVSREAPEIRSYQRGLQAYHDRSYADAVQAFSEALEREPDNPRLRFARGRAYQKLGDPQSALNDYHRAECSHLDDLMDAAKIGELKACMGYCYSQLRQEGRAIHYYQQALADGFQTAAVYNNLGFGLLRVNGKQADAERFLQSALARQPDLQAAHHNLALLDLSRALRDSKYYPHTGLRHVEQAIARGPGSAELHYDAARLYALASRQKLAHGVRAIEYLNLMSDLNWQPAGLAMDPTFRSVRGDPLFRRVVERTVPAVPTPRPQRVLDPGLDRLDDKPR